MTLPSWTPWSEIDKPGSHHSFPEEDDLALTDTVAGAQGLPYDQASIGLPWRTSSWHA